jgi:cysteine desulfurase
MEHRDEWYKHAQLLSRRLSTLLLGLPAEVVINSRDDGSPYILSFSIKGLDNAQVLHYLSDHGIYLSAASACSSNRAAVPKGTWRKKHSLLLQLAGLPKTANTTTYRVSFFAQSSLEDVQRLVAGLANYLQGEASGGA